MRNTYTKDPGGWYYTQKNSEVGPSGGAGYADPGGGMGKKDPGTLGHTQDPGGMQFKTFSIIFCN